MGSFNLCCLVNLEQLREKAVHFMCKSTRERRETGRMMWFPCLFLLADGEVDDFFIVLIFYERLSF